MQINSFDEFCLNEGKDDNIWYHITTVEALPKIKSSGGLDPKKSLNNEVILWRPPTGKSVIDYADTTIKWPAWVIRDTNGYIVLFVNLDGIKGEIAKDKKFGAQIHVHDVVPADRITKVSPLESPKYETVGIFKNGDKTVSVYKFLFDTKVINNSFYDDGNNVVASSSNGIIPKSLVPTTHRPDTDQPDDSFFGASDDRIKDIISWLDKNGFDKTNDEDPNLSATFVKESRYISSFDEYINE